MGVSGKFFVTCKRGLENCNHRVCPIWNSDEVEDIPANYKPELTQEEFDREAAITAEEMRDESMSLRDVNINLRGRGFVR
jgi:hypothetical protein